VDPGSSPGWCIPNSQSNGAMGENLFDNLDGIAVREDGQALWSARAPFRPEPDFDLMLVPRVPDWGADEDALAALERVGGEPGGGGGGARRGGAGRGAARGG